MLLLLAIVSAACHTQSGEGVPAAASAARTVEASPDPSGGTIAGAIDYPADVLPPVAIYAIATDGRRYYWMDRASFGPSTGPQDSDWKAYELMWLAPGDYYVFVLQREMAYWVPYERSSSVRKKPPRFSGAYTNAVQCGLRVGCDDHTPLAVHVRAGETVQGINPDDWYSSPLAFPEVPGSRPWAIPDGSLLWWRDGALTKTWLNSQRATRELVSVQAEYYDDIGRQCQVDRACGQLTGMGRGDRASAADYRTVQLGTYPLFRTCAFYFYARELDASQLLDVNCKRHSSSFPSVGGSGQVAFRPLLEPEPTCVNFHVAPDLTSRVLTCLSIGTPVTIDDGPVYRAQVSSDPTDKTLNYWWHAAGKGWVVHHYLMWSA